MYRLVVEHKNYVELIIFECRSLLVSSIVWIMEFSGVEASFGEFGCKCYLIELNSGIAH